MKLPKTVHVGALTYSITDDRAALLERCFEDLSRLLGSTDHVTCSIVIDDRLVEGQKRDTVLHEVLHTVISNCGLSDEWGVDKEEGIVRRITPGILAVLRDNPDLVAYLTEP